MLTMSLEGEEALVERFQGLPDNVHRALLAKIGQLTLMLENYVKDQKLNGQVLKRITGNLMRSINSEVDDSPAVITGVVFSAGDVKYARILEYGGVTKAHVIEAVNAKALHFQVGGKDVFVKKVNHPGSKIPEFRYMRSSLEENAATIREGMHEAVDQGLSK